MQSLPHLQHGCKAHCCSTLDPTMPIRKRLFSSTGLRALKSSCKFRESLFPSRRLFVSLNYSCLLLVRPPPLEVLEAVFSSELKFRIFSFSPLFAYSICTCLLLVRFPSFAALEDLLAVNSTRDSQLQDDVSKGPSGFEHHGLRVQRTAFAVRLRGLLVRRSGIQSSWKDTISIRHAAVEVLASIRNVARFIHNTKSKAEDQGRGK